MALSPTPTAYLYLAYLGRPQDAYSSSDFYLSASVLQPGLFHIFWDSGEYRLLGATDAATVIDEVYQRLFNRSAEAGGQAYWQQAVASGQIELNLLPAAILQGAQGADAQTLANKITAAQAFSAHIDTAPEKAAYAGFDSAAVGRDFVHAVGSDPASLNAALAAVDTAVAQAVLVGQPPATTFYLTPQADVVDTVTPTTVRNTGFGVSTNGPDTFYGFEGFTGEVDRLDGSGGQDSLWFTVANGVTTTTAPDVITSIETVRVSLPGPGVLDLSGVRDLQSVVIDAFAVSLGFLSTTTVQGLASTVEVDAALRRPTNHLVMQYSDRDLPDNSATLNMAGTMGGSLSVPGIEHLTLLTSSHLAGSVLDVTLGLISAPDAKSVTITGDGLLNLTNFELAPGAQLVFNSSGFINAAVPGTLSAGEGGHIVVNGEAGMNALLHESVASLVSNSSGDVSVVLDRFADARRSFSIEADGTGAIQVLGNDSHIAVTAKGGPQSDYFAPGSGAIDPATLQWTGNTLTGGGSDDDFVFGTVAVTNPADLIALANTITDFSKTGPSGDRIHFAQPLHVVTHDTASPGVARIDSAGFASFDASDTSLVQKVIALEAGLRDAAGLADNPYALFAQGGDTYLFYFGSDGRQPTGEALVHLVGVPADPSRFALVDGVLTAA